MSGKDVFTAAVWLALLVLAYAVWMFYGVYQWLWSGV